MIKLNIYAMTAHSKAIARGDYREDSSPMMPLCLASVYWRRCHQAQIEHRVNPDQPSRVEGYTLREEMAAIEIVRELEFLQHVGCRDIEKLIRSIVERDLK